MKQKLNIFAARALLWIKKQLQPKQEPKPILLGSIPHGIPQASHSGNIGDVLYACAFLKAYWQKMGKRIDLHLLTDQKCLYVVEHPLKNIRMSAKMAEQLRPVLEAQPYIGRVTIGPKDPERVDLPLDAFRELPINLKCGLIQGWYQLCSDLWLDLFAPWITAEKLPQYEDTLVVSRTARLRSEFIDYKFLNKYADKMLFLGLPEESERFKQETGINCRYLTVDRLDTMVNIIHSCRLFIGNQGFAYTVAESVKCPRLLESNTLAPNNYPLSPNGRIALFQHQFEAFAHQLNSLSSGWEQRC